MSLESLGVFMGPTPWLSTWVKVHMFLPPRVKSDPVVKSLGKWEQHETTWSQHPIYIKPTWGIQISVPGQNFFQLISAVSIEAHTSNTNATARELVLARCKRSKPRCRRIVCISVTKSIEIGMIVPSISKGSIMCIQCVTTYAMLQYR